MDDQSEAEIMTHAYSVESLTIARDAAIKFLDTQVSTFDTLDNKAATALSVGTIVLPLTFGILGFADTDLPLTGKIFLALAVLAYIVMLAGCVLVSKRTKALEYRPEIPELFESVASGEFHLEGLLLWIAEEYKASTEANKDYLLEKAKYVGWVLNALYAETWFLALAALVTLMLA